jgi:hypothetical protein
MCLKCKYFLFNSIIWALILVVGIAVWVNPINIIGSDKARIIIAIFIVLPFGALLQWLLLFKLGWKNIVIEAEKAVDSSISEDKLRDTPYSFATAFGTFERCLYLFILLSGKPEGLFLWLGFKAIAKWGQEENRLSLKLSKPFNLSLIGELINIFLSLVGVLIIKGSFHSMLLIFKP